ncbi:hypothetical protein N7539_002974 [Penicillium diatomitis]|uniref:Uncharacterized protein n=1 Tax=Penicillium diatomitis TaxID=2819901 RepID=A0A9W9XGX4_9EURO|nr:uncharacterized protein N7539_002974 [Penicillium diatomitis]KAJ5491407.1 hypothetical protein N7539_002974 [Penicillium diatomitis]
MVNTRIGGSQGSSTGAPGIPVSTQDPRSHYDPATTGYNPATGAAYAKPSAKSKGRDCRAPPPLSLKEKSKTDIVVATRSDRIWHTPNNVQRAEIEEATATSGTGDSSKSTTTEFSESSRRKAKRIGASVQVSTSDLVVDESTFAME